MHVRDEGEGEPVVLLHGLGASSRVFDPLFEDRRGRRLIALDLPRTARSRHFAPTTPEAVADAVLRLVEQRGVTRFHLFGHSFGGLVVMRLAEVAPERVLSLTVASTPALGLPAELRYALDTPLATAASRLVRRLPVWRPGLERYVRWVWGTYRKPEAHHLAWYEEALRAEGFSDSVLEALRAIARFQAPFAAIRAASFPRRVLWGEKDWLVPVVQGEQIAQALGAPLRVLTDVGHCVPEECPEAVLEALHER